MIISYRKDSEIELDDHENQDNSVLDTIQTSLRSKIPPKMIITADNLRLGELIGQGMHSWGII